MNYNRLKLRRMNAKIVDSIIIFVFTLLMIILASTVVAFISVTFNINLLPEVTNIDQAKKLFDTIYTNTNYLLLTQLLGSLFILVIYILYFTIGFKLNGSPGKYLFNLVVVNNLAKRPPFIKFLSREPFIIITFTSFVLTLIGFIGVYLFDNAVLENVFIQIAQLSDIMNLFILISFLLGNDIFNRLTKTFVIKS